MSINSRTDKKIIVYLYSEQIFKGAKHERKLLPNQGI